MVFWAFLFLYLGTDIQDRSGKDAFFRSLIWPVVACEYVESCNKIILRNDLTLEDR